MNDIKNSIYLIQPVLTGSADTRVSSSVDLHAFEGGGTLALFCSQLKNHTDFVSASLYDVGAGTSVYELSVTTASAATGSGVTLTNFNPDDYGQKFEARFESSGSVAFGFVFFGQTK